MKLLGTQNYKTVKGEKQGIITGILYLAPASISGWNVCPKASEGCKKACLYKAGRGGFNSVQLARIKKTEFYYNNRKEFIDLLRKDIKSLIKKAQTKNMIPAVRLNGTSDLNFLTTGIIEEFPQVRFYDYTKVLNRFYKSLPSNYSLTFSKSESNQTEVETALKLGANVAVVFNTKKGQKLPETYLGYPVYDGDDTDLRFLDPKNVVIGLRAKGPAIKDKSGFVIEA